ncbi:hypothetical protein EJB05_54654, partial [Eragrostis curvula]
MAAAAPWADLPEELLDRIFARLPSFADRACCTAVCSHWRFSAMQREHAGPPLLPWLLRPSTTGGSYFHLFSRRSSDEPGVLRHARGARFLGSFPGGWFIVARGQWRGYALLNLATGERVRLPDGLRGSETPDELRVGIHPSALLILAATKSPALTADGRYIVAAIASGHHKAVGWSPGMDRWMPLEPPGAGESHWWNMILLEGFEDVIYYSCEQHEGFYFLTSEERLLVFDSEFDEDEGGVPVFGDFTFYSFPGRLMTAPPEAGQSVTGRYLVESAGRLLMVKRFSSPERGTVSFQVFRLRWRNSLPYWQRSAVLIGQLLFIGRGCSRAFQTGRFNPGHIYFLDDAEGFRDSWSLVRTGKQYRCSDAGWCSYFKQFVMKRWPPGPPPDCSPWIWHFH